MMGNATATSDATLYLAAIASALVAGVVYFHLKAFSFWSSRGIQGPAPWPIFGTNIYYIFNHKLEVDRKWRQKYGHTFGLYEGYSPLLRTTDNKLIKFVYIKHFSSFTDRNHQFIYGDNAQNWLLWSKGSRWANQRALVSPMFSGAKMRLMLGTITQGINNFLESIVEKRIKLAGGKGSATLNKNDVSSMTLEVIATSFFGVKLTTYDTSNEFIRQAFSLTRTSLSWFLLWLLLPRHVARLFTMNLVRLKKFAYFDQLIKKIVEERRRLGRGATKSDMVQLFIDAKLPETDERVYTQEDDKEAHYNDQMDHKQLEGQQQEQSKQAKFTRFTDTEIRGQMTFMLLAGFETTATTITACLFELAHHHDAQTLLFEELKSKFGAQTIESGAFEFTKETYSDILDLKLLDAFVSEVLRLHSPILEHNRITTEPAGVDVPISDGKTVHLPQGVPISTSGFVLQRDEDYFENPNEFQLTRFLPENRGKIQSCTFMPFGVGPRYCAGMRFALLEVKLAVAKIVSRYTATPGPNNQSYPATYFSNPIFLIFNNSDINLAPRQCN